MPGRTLLFLAILTAAGTVPYLLMRGSEDKSESAGTNTQPTSLWNRLTGQTTALGQNAAGTAGQPNGSAVLDLPEPPGRPIEYPPMSGPPGVTLPDLLRFDLTPAWLRQNWAHVTSCLTEPDWQGLRVPVVTGTQFEDLAGTVTYSFNTKQQVERIHLYGLAGDAEPVAAFVQQRLGMRQYPSSDWLLYLGFFHEEPLSMLRIRTLSTQAAQKTSARYEIDLEMNLPRPGAKLSDKRQKLWQLQVDSQKMQEAPPSEES
jgi:hypothetical protein